MFTRRMFLGSVIGALVLSAHGWAQPPAPGVIRPIALPAGHNVRSISPDGRYVAFAPQDLSRGAAKRRSGLSIRDLTAKTERALVVPTETESLHATSPVAWSPDSRRLAFVWCQQANPAAGIQLGCEVRLAGLDGSAPHAIVPRTAGHIEVFDWSPDGRALFALFSRGSNRRYALIDLNDGRQRDVSISNSDSDEWSDFRAPGFSPDGRFIAYTQQGWQEKPYEAYLPGDVFIVGLDDGEDRPLLQGPDSETFVGWAPDGSLLFTSDKSGSTDLYRIGVADGRVRGTPSLVRKDLGAIIGRRLTGRGHLFFQTPYDYSGDIHIAETDPSTGRITSAPRPLSSDRSRRRSTPAWSPDGKFLAYGTGPAKPAPTFVTDGFDSLTIRSMDTGQERTVRLDHACTDGWHSWQMFWMPNSDSLLLSVTASAASCRGLFSVARATGSVKMIAEGPQYLVHAQPLAGGRALVYLRTYQTVVERDVETGRERVVVDLKSPTSGFEGGSFGVLAVSRSGTRAAVTIKTRDSQKRITELMLSDGRLRVIPEAQVTSTSGWDTLAWSADDRHLLYVTDADGQRAGEVLRVPVAGGAPHPIDLTTTDPGEVIRFLAVSPDGRQLAFQRERTTREALFVIENFLPARALRGSGIGAVR